MSAAQLAARLYFLAVQLQGEAQRHERGDVRTDLERAARQLRWAFSAAYSQDPTQRASTEALAEGALTYLVNVITARTERMLEQGATP